MFKRNRGWQVPLLLLSLYEKSIRRRAVECNVTCRPTYIMYTYTICKYIYLYTWIVFATKTFRFLDAGQKCLNVQLGSRGAVFNRLKSSAHEGLIVRCLYGACGRWVVYAGVLSDPDNALGIISRLQVRGRRYAHQPVTRWPRVDALRCGYV